MTSASEAIFKWSWYIMGYEIGFSIVIGFAVGYVARKILKFSEKRYVILFTHDLFLTSVFP
jgi:NhaP-type Na+/H+ or K+/H+ antiporter